MRGSRVRQLQIHSPRNFLIIGGSLAKLGYRNHGQQGIGLVANFCFVVEGIGERAGLVVDEKSGALGGIGAIRFVGEPSSHIHQL